MNFTTVQQTIRRAVATLIRAVQSLFGKTQKTLEPTAEHEHRIAQSLTRRKIPSPKQLRYGWRILSSKEQRLVKTYAGLAVAALVVFGGVFVYNRTTDLPTSGGTYIEGVLKTPQFLNPVLAFNNDTDVNLNRLIFSGLLKTNTNLELENDLAESFTINEDETVYTFVLRQDAKWHDGEPVTVDDVVFTIETIQNPQFNSPHFGRFQGVQVNKLNEKTVEFILEKPFASFLQNLTTGILPKHMWQTIPASNSTLAELNIKPIGSGPYAFSKLQKDTNGQLISYTLERFDDYYDAPVYIDEIQFKFYPDLNSAVDALQKQNIDGMEYLPQENRTALATTKGLNLYTFSLPQYTAIFFNSALNETLGDTTIRTALTHAVNKQAIIEEIFDNEAQIIEGPLLPGSIGYYKDIQTYPFDILEAERLLEEAGWIIPEPTEENPEPSNYRAKDDTELALTITTVDVPDTIRVAEQIKNSWEAVGVRVELQIIPKNTIEADIITPRNYQVLLFGQILGAEADPFPFWHSSKRQSPGVNLSDFGDPRADVLLEDARSAPTEERITMYHEFQDILKEQQPAIFLYSPTYTYPVNEKIKGIHQTNINSPADRFNGLTNWYIRTSRQWAGK